MLTVGLSCFKKHELNTKWKYSNTALQKTHFHTCKSFTAFKFCVCVNVHQDKYQGTASNVFF